MKKRLLISIVTILLSFEFTTSMGQMTLIGAIPKDFLYTESQIVNLSISGKKIMTMVTGGCTPSLTADTIFFYNMDLSYWKRIILPYLPGFKNQYFSVKASNPVNVFYPSETLFNLDPLLEVAILCVPTTGAIGKYYILNESGIFTDSILNANVASLATFHVFEDTTGIFKLSTLTTNGFQLYRLPGTIPCNTCSTSGGTLGIVATEKPFRNSIETKPIPNPSSDQVKITFSLPEGVNMGTLVLYNSIGQKIKSCQVDNRFGFILVDNKELASGVYYYNIETNSSISSTQKILVLR